MHVDGDRGVSPMWMFIGGDLALGLGQGCKSLFEVGGLFKGERGYFIIFWGLCNI